MLKSAILYEINIPEVNTDNTNAQLDNNCDLKNYFDQGGQKRQLIISIKYIHNDEVERW
jgi:hypothetical protein